MTNIITYANFTGSIAIDTYRPEIQESLGFYIAETQEKILKSLLGNILYYDMEVNILLPKFVLLRDGDPTVYDFNGVKNKYTGLKEMLAYFTYYYYNRNETSSNTPQGETVSTTNGTPVMNIHKLHAAYNNGVRLYYSAISYIFYKNSIDPTTYADFMPAGIDEVNSFGI